jgi:hypothetical protein
MNDFVAVVLSVKYGTTELLQFETKDERLRYLPAMIDSGTSCLVSTISVSFGSFIVLSAT